MKAKVLFVVTKHDVGGAQKYVRDLAERLSRDRFQGRVLYGGRDLRSLSNETHPFLFLYNDWRAMFELLRVYRREAPDLVHLNSSKAGVIGALAAWLYNTFWRKPDAPKLKVVFTAHGWVFNPTNDLSLFLRLCYKLLHKIAAWFQDAIINVSDYDRAIALRASIAPARKLFVVKNGIDPTIQFLSRPESRKAIGDALKPPTSLDPAGQWVGSIGRLTREKNYAMLVKAMRHIPAAALVIVGDGYEREYLQSLIRAEGLERRAVIVPPTGEDARYLKAFDVFALSSVKEGLPYVLLEALAAEIPAVVTDAGGMPEVVGNEKNGLVVPRRNPEVLGKAIAALLGDPPRARAYAREGKRIVTCDFSVARMVEETKRIYLAQMEKR